MPTELEKQMNPLKGHSICKVSEAIGPKNKTRFASECLTSKQLIGG